MSWMLLIAMVVFTGDTLKRDTICVDLAQARRIIINTDKKQNISKEVDQINGKLDSLIRELKKDTIK